MGDVELMTAAVLADPADGVARLVLADAIAERTGDYAAALAEAERVQKTSEGTEVVTVARDGARTTGGSFARPIYCTAIYRAKRRLSDGVLTWRRVGSANDATSGNGVTGPMIARAKNVADTRGLEYKKGVRHGDKCE